MGCVSAPSLIPNVEITTAAKIDYIDVTGTDFIVEYARLDQPAEAAETTYDYPEQEAATA